MATTDSTSETPLKKCTKCGQGFPATTEYFHPANKTKDGLRSRCRPCTLEDNTEQRRAKGARPAGECYWDGKKLCPVCKEWKPYTEEHFGKNKNTKSGLMSNCKECNRAHVAKHHEEHPEIHQEWRENNRDRLRILARQNYYKRTGGKPHQPKQIDGQRYCPACDKWKPATLEFWYQSSSGSNGLATYCIPCGLTKMKSSYERNKEARLRYIRQWTEEAKTSDGFHEAKRLHVRRRRARKRDLPDTLTPEQWQQALDYFGGCCAVCGRSPGLWHTIAADHWIPLSKGGGTTADNIVPLCHGQGGCNNSKHSKDAYAWLLSIFGKRKAKKALTRIEAYFEWMKQRL